MPFAVLIPLILQNLPAIISVGEAGIAFITHVRSAAKQAGAWTPEAETAFTDSLIADAISPEWQPDPK